MPEALGENLESVREMALNLLDDLDSYKHERELADLWFSEQSEETMNCLLKIREGWKEQNVKRPPIYIPVGDIPSAYEINNTDSPFKLDFYIDILMNTIRFLRLLGSIKNELPSSRRHKLSVEITGMDIDRVEDVSDNVRNAISGFLPFSTSTSFSSPEGNNGPVHEVIFVPYLDGFAKELQDAVIRTRLSILFQNTKLELDEDKFVIKID